MDACTINKNVILSDLIKSIPIGCCVYRETLQHIEFVIWNKHMVDITGYTLEEINEVGWPNIFYDTYSINDFNKVGLDEDYKITSKDGTKKIINITTSSINTDEGRDSILALVKDITKYKHLEQELAEIEERYEKILRLSTDSILIHDSE